MIPGLRRLEAIALEQLRAECARLVVENDQLRASNDRAEEAAEFWRGEAMNLHDELAETLPGKRALTQLGHLVVVPAASMPA
jgi:hypothetical protein